MAGQITIAAFATAARGLAPQALRDLRTRYPQLAITFHEQEPARIDPRPGPPRRRPDHRQRLAQRAAGAARGPDQGAAVRRRRGCRAATRPPAREGEERHPLGELAGQEWITWQAGSICHDWLLHTLRKEGHEPQIAHTAAEFATQLALVAAGLGAAVLPRLGRDPLPKGVTVVPAEPSLRRHVYAAWRTHATRRQAIKAVVSAFRTAAQELTNAAVPQPRKKGR